MSDYMAEIDLGNILHEPVGQTVTTINERHIARQSLNECSVLVVMYLTKDEHQLKYDINIFNLLIVSLHLRADRLKY